MADDIPASRLQSLATRTFRAFERAAAEIVPGALTLSAALRRSLESAAGGDLTEANLSDVVATEEGRTLRALVVRFRRVIQGGRRVAETTPRAVDQLVAASSRVADASARHQVDLERCLDDIQRTASRARELQALIAEVAEASDRASLLALNTGIEGMRAGGEAARALTLLGEEIRRLSQRAHTGASDLGAGVSAVAQSAEAAAQRIVDARQSARSLAESATQATAAVESVRRAEDSFRASLEGWRILDEETESLMASVNETADRLDREMRALAARINPNDHLGRQALERALARVASLSRVDDGER